MKQLIQVRRFPLFINIFAVLNLAAGLHGQFGSGVIANNMGRLGGAIEAAGGPPPPESVAAMKDLQARLHRSTVIGAVLLGLAIAVMASARYIG
jgi:hypothetical protein